MRARSSWVRAELEYRHCSATLRECGRVSMSCGCAIHRVAGNDAGRQAEASGRATAPGQGDKCIAVPRFRRSRSPLPAARHNHTANPQTCTHYYLRDKRPKSSFEDRLPGLARRCRLPITNGHGMTICPVLRWTLPHISGNNRKRRSAYITWPSRGRASQVLRSGPRLAIPPRRTWGSVTRTA